MKRQPFLLSLLLGIVFSLFSTQSKAVGASAGEILFTYVSDSTYRIVLRLHVDCSMGAEPDSLPLCLYNSCSNSATSLYINKWTSNTPSNPPSCSNNKTTCDSINSAIPGYKEYWYQKIVTLPRKCTEWRASVYVDRNDASNIVNATSNVMYLEASINNTISDTNSTALYQLYPIIYSTINQQTSYSSNLLNDNADSVYIELATPQTGVSSCNSASTNVGFVSNSPSLSIPNNPFQTNNQFSIDHETGAITFTPTQLGKHSIAIRTNDYRNGVLIGSSIRELQVQTLAVPTNPPISFALNCGQSLPSQGSFINACEGQPLSFCFDAVSSVADAQLYVAEKTNIPSSNFLSITRSQGDSIHGIFTWTPPQGSNGIYYLTLDFRDTTCRTPYTNNRHIYNIPIKVFGATEATADTFICPNGTIQLKASGGEQYRWTILTGGTPNSLSCDTCDSTWASPTATTTYAVVSTGSTFCPDYTDTVTVTVVQPSSITYPSINISVTPDSNIVSGTPVTFTANVSGCNNPTYSWTINGSTIANSNTNTYTSSLLSNNDIIVCRVMCVDSCPSPRDTFSNAITMHVTNTTQNILANNNTEISLYPNPNNGIFNLEVIGIPTGTNNLNIDILNPLGQTVYSKKVTTSGSSYTDNIQLNELSSGIYMLRISDKSGTSIVRFTVAK